MESWRWLFTPDLPGAQNMAIDSAVARLVMQGRVPPTLRFFTWKPFCLSLGYNQPSGDVDYSRCRKLGVDVVRRPTGGRAVYHAREWTYSVVCSAQSALFRSSILETYLLIARWLVAGLQNLGVAAELAPELRGGQPHPSVKNPACFSVPSSYEIMVEGRKLVGSAQRRWPEGMLQHGSILVGPDHLHLPDFFAPSVGEAKVARARLEQRTAWLEQFLVEVPALEEFGSKMAALWAELFGVEVRRGQLTEEELRLAEELQPEFELFSAHTELKEESQP